MQLENPLSASRQGLHPLMTVLFVFVKLAFVAKSVRPVRVLFLLLKSDEYDKEERSRLSFWVA